MLTQDLINHLNEQLQVDSIKDYCPNGLQVEGKSQICKILTGVTASQALVDEAVTRQVDALLVHHGYFWKGEAYPVVGIKKKRLKALLAAEINLIAYHLPLDIHPQWGNNARLAELLGLGKLSGMEPGNPCSIPMVAEPEKAITGQELAERIESKLNRQPLWIQTHNRPLKRIGLCTGGGQSFIELAAAQGCDAFISGEVAEPTYHLAHELGLDYFAAGHHATERYGVKALGEYLAQTFNLNVEFLDIPNPV